jgi:hypothetical protein
MGASEKKYEKSRHGEAATPFLLSHCIFQRNERNIQKIVVIL